MDRSCEEYRLYDAPLTLIRPDQQGARPDLRSADVDSIFWSSAIPPVGTAATAPAGLLSAVDLLRRLAPVGPAGHLRDALPPMVGFTLVLLGSLVPSTVAIVLVATMRGKAGVGRLLSRLVKWRVGVRWYLVVLILSLLAPLAIGLSILLGGPAPTVDVSIIAVVGMFIFSIFPGSALGEEVGWRGFALPHLQDHHRAVTAALILGPVWGFWHLPLWLTGRDSNPLILFPSFVLSAVALSVLVAWIYNRTGGSLLLVVLLHATANLPVTLLIAPLGSDMVQPFFIFTALLIIAAVAVIGVTGSTNLSRTQPKQISEDVPAG